MRHRRRPVRHRLGREDAEALRPQRQRPRPYAATSAFFATRGSTEIPTTGPLSWSVPGCVDGWDELRAAVRHEAAHGRCSPRRSTTPRRGSPSARSSPPTGSAGAGAGRDPDLGRRLPPRRQGPAGREVFRNPDLARPSRDRRRRPRRLLRGPIAEAIVAYSEQVGGLFAPKDFADHTRRGSSRSPRPIAATTSGSCRPTGRGSRCSRCSTSWSPTTSRRWARSRPTRST